jgi:hypothetical protein
MPPDDPIKISSLPSVLGLDRSTIHRFITYGKRSAGGEMVKLERFMTEVGWCTNRQLIERFRQKLNA